MGSTDEVPTIARRAAKFGKELVAEESPQPASSEIEARRKNGSRRFPKGADRVKQLRREMRVAEPFCAFQELPDGLSTCFHPAEGLGLGCG